MIVVSEKKGVPVSRNALFCCASFATMGRTAGPLGVARVSMDVVATREASL
jgi:hypothetical protein